MRTDEAKSDLSGRVTLVEKLGEVTLAYIDHGEATPIVVKATEETPFKTGETANFRLERDRLHFFDADGHRLS